MNVSTPLAQRRPRRALAQTALLGLAAASIAVIAGQAAQAVPAAPHNIVVFPQRDFIALEGYTDRLTEVGKTATVVVTRGAVETSRATGTIAAGGLEINHPGGVCWDGVTPDIKPGDVVRVSIPGAGSDSTIVQTPEIMNQGTPSNPVGFRKAGAFDLVVEGKRSANYPLSRIEQRIVAPDLNDTEVGRRDIRAPGRPGPYTSTFEPNGTTGFTATYHFVTDGDTTAAEATEMRDIAADGQMRALGWEALVGGERQGLTISEFGEAGGPGFGGCPTGPETMGPNAPTNVAATAGVGSVTATWTKATTIPDGSPITGYQVKAVNTVNSVGTTVEVPLCTTGCTATIPGLSSGVPYQIEVRAQSAAGMGKKGVAPTTVSPKASTLVQPAAPTGVTGTAGNLADLAVDARVAWTAPTQPTGVTVEAWRVTAYDAAGARIKRVFLDEPTGAADASRSRSIGFASARSVIFRVQAISADEAGTMSSLSAASTAVAAQ
jgi:Fibronectin type III domain